MHTVALITLRSVSRSPARFLGRRRYPCSTHARHFHSAPTTLRASSLDSPEPAIPPTSHKDGTESQASPEEASEIAESEDVPAGLEERFPRSKKEGNNNGYGSAMRRSTRSRLREIPPVEIPEWFFKRNVRLLEDQEAIDAPSHTACEYVIYNKNNRDILGRLPILLPSELVGNLQKAQDHSHRNFICFILGALQSLTLLETRQALALNNILSQSNKIWELYQSSPELFPAENNDSFHNWSSENLIPLEEAVQRYSPLPQGKPIPPNALTEADGEPVPETPISDPVMTQNLVKGQSAESPRQVEKAQFRLGLLPFLPFSSQCSVSFQVALEIRACIAGFLDIPGFRPDNVYAESRNTLILHCPLDGGIEYLDKTVQQIAGEVGADIIALDAQDLAELGASYVGDGRDPPLQGIRSLGYETYRSDRVENTPEPATTEETDETEDPENAPVGNIEASWRQPKPILSAHIIPLYNPRVLQDITKALEKSGIPGMISGTRMTTPQELYSTPETRRNTTVKHWEELKFNALLEVLVEAADTKRKSGKTSSLEHSLENDASEIQDKVKSANEAADLTSPVSKPSFEHALGSSNTLTMSLHESLPGKQSLQRRGKIILLRDFKELQSAPQGSQIISKLMDVIQRRRKEGERVMLVGITSSAALTPDLSPDGIVALETDDQDTEHHTIFVPLGGIEPAKESTVQESLQQLLHEKSEASDYGDVFTQAESRHMSAVNLRQIESMLKALNPSATPFEFRDSVLSRALGSEYLPFCAVHRLAVTAMGLQQLARTTGSLTSAHILLALILIESSDAFKQTWVTQLQGGKLQPADLVEESSSVLHEQGPKRSVIRPKQIDIEALGKTCNKHERRLLHGVINAEAIKTTFSSVHAPEATIDTLKTLTSLSLIRPDAFAYGVLAADKIPGLLLYGPPGTGKTLLAKAVAREGGATVLEVSGSEVYDMYVGEGEKNVRAIFSLARKLSPCVVFIDEADAIFRSRSGSQNRNSQREIINQFLREWDGMNDLSVFIMVATNRPFDLDDAVLRRLPRRLLVDLPMEKDREAILQIHLREEILEPSISLQKLARTTPFYSGSDLKNLCVAAALNCVREENTLASEAKAKDEKYQYPAKRLLRKGHFDKALEEISASISEDMESLGAIRKFDEQYGERRSRRKKAWGFGDVDEAAAERAARVRQDLR